MIQQKRKEQAAARRPQGTPLQHPTSYSNSVLELPFFDHTLTAYAPPKPGVYSRRALLDDAIKVRTQGFCDISVMKVNVVMGHSGKRVHF